MSVLITGGAGYIGSHTCVELLQSGYDIVVVDNFYNSSAEALRRVKNITNKDFRYYEIDVCDREMLRKVFSENHIDAVIHFAGYKAVGESVEKPLMYYDNNLISTLSLLSAMKDAGVNKMVFSSSATVYSGDNPVPLEENMILGAINPYGKTKLFIEEMLRDYAFADENAGFALLRYFNPIGAHKSGLIGESPKGIPNNLMPYISQVAVGKLKELCVFGDDYETRDGTGSRDYIHVVDLAKGHVKAIEWVLENTGCEAINLGTGKGTTVFELKEAFEKASGITIPYTVTGRRAGDLAEVYALPEKARKILGWEAELTVEDMCRDTWNWQKNNPDGYGE